MQETIEVGYSPAAIVGGAGIYHKYILYTNSEGEQFYASRVGYALHTIFQLQNKFGRIKRYALRTLPGYNPVKHGWVKQVKNWPYSTFHRWVERGVYPLNWAGVDGDLYESE